MVKVANDLPENIDALKALIVANEQMLLEKEQCIAVLEEQLARDPFSGQLFVFVNRKRDKVKILYWEHAGFCLWQKRLERERFKWPDHLSGDALTLDGQQLNWLLDGYNLAAMRPHRSLAYTTVL
jgi:transposase